MNGLRFRVCMGVALTLACFVGFAAPGARCDTLTFNVAGFFVPGSGVNSTGLILGSFTLDQTVGTLVAWNISSPIGAPHTYTNTIAGSVGMVVSNGLGQLELFFETPGTLQELELNFIGSATTFAGGAILT